MVSIEKLNIDTGKTSRKKIHEVDIINVYYY